MQTVSFAAQEHLVMEKALLFVYHALLAQLKENMVKMNVFLVLSVHTLTLTVL